MSFVARHIEHVSRRSPRSSSMATVVALLAMGCGSDDPEGTDSNVLPTQAGTADDGSSSSPTATDTAPSDTSADTTMGNTTEPVGEVTPPAAYRFECIDIQVLGDADGTAFQASLLEDTWSSDIDDYKLNIIFEVQSRDAATSAGEVAIRSGIGSGPDDMCIEPTSASDVIAVAYDSATALWATSDAEGTCSAPAPAATESSGSYTMTLGPDVLVYIYAQDTDGTTFNCTADAATPDAVPVRAVEAELTASPDGHEVAGQLTGCLLSSEAAALCSCLGSCNPATMNENCGGCPDGSVPLQSLLQGINPSTRCTDLLGADAFDLTLGFSARALPAVPTQCGG